MLGGIEKLRIVPGITAANPLDLYYMPYTHSLVAALLWSAAAAVVSRVVFVLSLLAVQIASLVGPLPTSPATVAASGLGVYLLFAAVAAWVDGQRVPVARGRASPRAKRGTGHKASASE